MAGDIGIREQAIILPAGASLAAAAPVRTNAKRRVVHMYGSRVMVVEASEEDPAAMADATFKDAGAVDDDVRATLSKAELLGLDALGLRQSNDYRNAKAARPHEGAAWDSGVAMQPSCHDITVERSQDVSSLEAGAPTSTRLTGTVAVGIVIVEGPNTNLKFSQAERVKVVAEVQNGLGWLATQSPEGVTFKYDIQVVTLNTQPGAANLNSDQKEALWRDPAMARLGFGNGMSGVTAYVESLRTRYGTTWAYCGFFTKYPVGWFAYASIGGPRLVMDYANDGWGPDNIDRVFTHESGHIFGAPDEYAASNCSCGGSWGYYGKPNGNCANCAPSGGVDCLMKQNSWAMCALTPYHLGFPLVEQTYTGVWRQGTDPHYLWVNASWNSFNTKWQQLAGQNLRLHDLKITRTGNDERFHGVWRAGTGGHYLWVNADWNSFNTKWQQLAAQNLRLVDIEVQNVNGTLLYSGVWLPGSDGYYLWANADWSNFNAKWQQLAGQNLRLVDIKIVNVGGQQRFFGVWRQGTGGHYLWVNADWANFTAKWQQLASQNLRLVDIEITQTPQGQRFSGVWLPGTDAYYLWSGSDWQHFRAKWEELAAQNLRLIDIDVVPAGGAQSAPPPVLSEFGGLAEQTKSLAQTGYAGRRKDPAAAGSAAAAPAASGDDEDGMGGPGPAAGSDDGAGFGGGSVRDSPAVEGSGAEYAGLGGGSLVGTGASESSESAGFGGGSTAASSEDSATVFEGKGGGSLS